MGPGRALLFGAVLLLRLAGALGGSRVCIIGSGIGGSSVAHFLKQYSCDGSGGGCLDDIRILERRGTVGGRMATVTIGGNTFEAGASIIHPKNLHALRFADLLNLTAKSKSADFTADSNASSSSSSSSWLGIWDGSRFRFKTLPPPPSSSSALYRKIHSLLNTLLIFRRYGFSLLRMNRFVQKMVDRFLLYYGGFETRPVFETVEEMLRWSGLYGLTRRTLQEELAEAGLSSLLISELVTVTSQSHADTYPSPEEGQRSLPPTKEAGDCRSLEDRRQPLHPRRRLTTVGPQKKVNNRRPQRTRPATIAPDKQN